MKQKRPGPYIAGYLTLVGLFVILFASGGIIVSTKNVLGFKYEPYSLWIGLSLILAGILVLAISVKFFIWAMRRMATNLDILFENLELTAEQHGMNGRHYFGSIDNRKIEIYCKPINNRRHFGKLKTVKYIGHSLEIIAAANLATRSSIIRLEENEEIQTDIRAIMVKSLTENLIEKYGGDVIKVDDRDFRDFVVYALDTDWTKAFLASPETHTPLKLLLGTSEKNLRQNIQLKPDQVSFTTLFNIRRFKKCDMKNLVENTIRIAVAAESITKQ